MEAELLDLTGWDALDAGGKERIARAVADRLPEGFRWRGIEPCAQNGQRHEIALFEWECPAPGPGEVTEVETHATLALVLGGAITLGYDRRIPTHRP
jgi:hypothetical protein